MSRVDVPSQVGRVPLSRAAELAFAVFGIHVLAGGHYWAGGFLYGSNIRMSEGSLRLQALLAAIYGTSLLLTLNRPRTWWRATRADLGLVALLAWTLASVLWSDAPQVSFVRGLALLGTSCFGLYLAARYPVDTQLRLLGVGLAPVVLYNALLAMTETGAISQGAFDGWYDHKNSLGRIMVMCTVAFLCLPAAGITRLMTVGAAAMSFGLVVLSGSATGLIVILTLLGLIPFSGLLKGDVRLLVSIGAVAVLLLGSVALMLPQLVEYLAPALGRDATLTGRTELWPVVLELISRRPLLGYGYAAFWSSDTSLGISWRPSQAHNGFLDVALALGLIGLAIFGFILGRGIVRALRFFRERGTRESSWPITYFAYIMLYNITEGTSLSRNSILWVLFVSALITVSPTWMHDARASRSEGRGRPTRARSATRPPVASTRRTQVGS